MLLCVALLSVNTLLQSLKLCAEMSVLTGTVCFHENSLLFCQTAHVTHVEGGSVLWRVVEGSLAVIAKVHSQPFGDACF